MKDEIFQLTVQKENFEIFFEINQNYNTIIDRLCSEFWSTLETNLLNKKDSRVSKLISHNWNIDINVKKWGDFYLFIEWTMNDKINLGIYNEKLRRNQSNSSRILDSLTTEFILNEGENKLCIYKSIKEDFSKFSNLNRLIPENRNEFCEDIYLEVSNMIDMLNMTITNWEK